MLATCDPALARLGEVCERLEFVERGVETYEGFDEMITSHSGHFDLGVIASPIQFHASMHAAIVQGGAACYLEKPPTLSPLELNSMLSVEASASVPTNVGFSFVHLEDRIQLKRRMMSGEFGRLQRLGFLGLAPRPPAYFQRNNWAGRLELGGQLVLDSCLGNAMAHFVNNMLFFGNLDDVTGWARPQEMECELYRANPIEGTDTIFALCRLTNGVELRLAASHACMPPDQIFEETLVFEEATITIRSAVDVTIERDGRSDETFSMPGASLTGAVQYYLDFLSGVHKRPAQTLRDCQGFVETNALFYLAAKQIHQLPRENLSQVDPESTIVLPDVEASARKLVCEALMPSRAGYPWAKIGGHSTIHDMPLVTEVVKRFRCSGEQLGHIIRLR